MAVRNDFTAGEVLAAADLNDTFASKADYPAGGTDGQALLKSGTTTAWGAAGGLVFIDSGTASGASSLSINGCFSSTYDNYRVVAQLDPSSTDATYLVIRMRASGTDLTDSVYQHQRLLAQSTTVSGDRNTNATSMRLGLMRNNNETYIAFDIARPFATEMTTIFSQSPDMGGGASAGLVQFAGGVNNTTSYDGFTVLPESGTFTGVVRVYGYANS